jgi:Tfp pilus assembly protein FimT
MVIAMIGILAAVVLPSSQPNVQDQLLATAQTVADELAYARSLAMANNSKYRFTFDVANNRMVLQHSGTSAALADLPASPFRSPKDPSNQHIVDLDELPHVGAPLALLAATVASSSSVAAVSSVEFGPLGATTASNPTTVWLTAGTGAGQRYVSVAVNPVTGLATVGQYTTQGPPAGVLSGL